MEGWKVTQFNNILEIPLRNGLTKPKAVRGKGCKLVNMGELFSFQRIDTGIQMDLVPVTEKEYANNSLELGDLLFARQSLVLEGAGKCSIVQRIHDNAVFESHLIRARINKNIADALFYYYYFSSSIGRKNIGTIVEQVSAAGIRGSDLAKLTVPFPPLSTQRAIAATLSCLDDKIELNNRINASLEAQAQAIFKSWFVGFQPFQSGEFVESKLGRIPKGWKVVPFTDIVQILSGGTPKTGNSKNWEGFIPFFTPKDTNSAAYVIETEKHLSEAGLNSCNSRLYPINTVFVTARGTVGKVAIAGQPMAMNQSCYALIGRKNISQSFVHQLTLNTVSALQNKASGAVFDAIVIRDFESEYVVQPSLFEINRYSSIIQPIYQMMLSATYESRSLEQLRDSLLPKLMSGEIEVPAED